VSPVDHDGPVAVRALTLEQNHPNPFNPATVIRFALPQAGPVELAVYDLAGRRVRRLIRGEREAGPHAVRWDGRDEHGQRAPSGMYVYRLEAAGESLTRKMLLVK
jgi:flagellar hook assembly protein FlgD